MDILFIIPYTPTPIRVRPYNLIKHLSQRGHQVVLATVYETPVEQTALQDLRASGISVLAQPLSRKRRVVNELMALPTRAPLQSYYSWQPGLAHAVQSLLNHRRFDAVHVEHLRGARYGLLAKSQCAVSTSNRHTPITWDSVDCITYLFRQTAQHSRSLFGRLVSRIELGRTERYEGWLVSQFDHVLVTTETDRSQMDQIAGSYAKDGYQHQRIRVLANGVDLVFFTPRDLAPEPNTIVFSGKMSYHANVTAAIFLANEVMPLVWRQRPDTRLIIAGSQPAEHVRRLANHSNGQIEVTGYVNDLRTYLWRASVVVAPLLYGAGIQNKVLEALACSKPVVATPRAVAALGAEAMDACLVADQPQPIANAIVKLLEDPELGKRMGRMGRYYVERYHDWNHIATQLEAIYQMV